MKYLLFSKYCNHFLSHEPSLSLSLIAEAHAGHIHGSLIFVCCLLLLVAIVLLKQNKCSSNCHGGGGQKKDCVNAFSKQTFHDFSILSNICLTWVFMVNKLCSMKFVFIGFIWGIPKYSGIKYLNSICYFCFDLRVPNNLYPTCIFCFQKIYNACEHKQNAYRSFWNNKTFCWAKFLLYALNEKYLNLDYCYHYIEPLINAGTFDTTAVSFPP